MKTHEQVAAHHINDVLERGARTVLVRQPDGSLHTVPDSFLTLDDYVLVWSGDLSDLGDGWEMDEDEQGNKILCEGEEELAARILNEMP